jgi:SAM-dependent methyltransferase
VSVYSHALRRAATGAETALDLVDPVGGTPVRRLRPTDWCGPLRDGDAALVDRCSGPTLDVGCGPGRLAGALVATGVSALGVDVNAEAVRQARRRGVPTVHRDVFGALPGEGRWRHVLLADGNIGIGGDPYRLLARCRDLLHPAGDVLVELDPPGTGSWRARVALRHGGRVGSPFPWAAVAADDLAAIAERAGLAVLETWREGTRWFARCGSGQHRGSGQHCARRG